MVLGLLLSGCTSGPKTYAFEKWGMTFQYPENVTIEANDQLDAKSGKFQGYLVLTFTNEKNEAIGTAKLAKQDADEGGLGYKWMTQTLRDNFHMNRDAGTWNYTLDEDKEVTINGLEATKFVRTQTNGDHVKIIDYFYRVGEGYISIEFMNVDPQIATQIGESLELAK